MYRSLIFDHALEAFLELPRTLCHPQEPTRLKTLCSAAGGGVTAMCVGQTFHNPVLQRWFADEGGVVLAAALSTWITRSISFHDPDDRACPHARIGQSVVN